MKTKWMLTLFGIWYVIEGISVFFTSGDFYFMSYGFGIFCVTLGLICLLIRDEGPSRLHSSILFVFSLSTLGVSLIAYYAQWKDISMQSPADYIIPTIWLLVAIGFFLVSRRSSVLPKVRSLQ
jgi:hypothetical protein